MLETINKLKELGKQRDQLVRQLEMWAHIKAQGIDPESVVSLTFDPKMMTDEERREARRLHPHASQSNPYDWPEFRNEEGRLTIRTAQYNCARLSDGTSVRLNPVVDRP